MDDRYVTVSEKEPETVTVDKQSSEPVLNTSTPDYDYGRNQEPLDGTIAVRGGAGGGSQYATATTRSATGDLTITGCPFTPKYVRVDAHMGFVGCTSTSAGWSSGGVGSISGNFDSGKDNSNSYIIILRDNSGTVTHRATLSSFTSDGCVINFSVASGTAGLLVTLYG
jgi:hypothetical protein